MTPPSSQIRIESFTDFEDRISEIKERIRTLNPTRAMLQSEPLYRGQANAEWELMTTLERFLPDAIIQVNRYNSYLARARATVETVTCQKWPFSDVRELSMDHFFDELPNFEFMVYARHHGFPSPLLDWTRSPYIALYFAFANASPSQDAALFAFIKSPEGMRSASRREPQISELPHHKTTHPRHFAQQSRYTICVRNPEGPEDWEYCPHELVIQQGRVNQDLLQKFVLPAALRLEILDRLDHMNINGYTLFNNEDGLMKSLAFREIEALEARRRGEI